MKNDAPPLIEAGSGPVCLRTVEDVGDAVIAALTAVFPGRVLDARAVASGLAQTAIEILQVASYDEPIVRLMALIADARPDSNLASPISRSIN